MASINTGRVVAGGLLAGLVINVGEYLLNEVVLQAEMAAFMERFNLPPTSGASMAVLVALGFVGGIALVWIYAGIRPRFGPGPRTAAYAGVAGWLFAYFWPGIVFAALGMWAWGPTMLALVWGIVEFALAAVAGAWLYKEGGAAPAM